jgi:hypothetical protein
VHSADGLSSTLPKKSSSVNADRLSSSALTLSPEESRVIKMAKAQFDRRGGFVRIFPAVDSWTKYSQYLGNLFLAARFVPCHFTMCCFIVNFQTTFKHMLPNL